MCLSRSDCRLRIPKYGYKVMVKVKGGYYSEIMGRTWPNGKLLIRNEWLHEGNYRKLRRRIYLSCAFTYDSYHTGWHVFTSLKSARAWIKDGINTSKRIVKVRLRGVDTMGWQGQYRVAVCREIKIIKRIK